MPDFRVAVRWHDGTKSFYLSKGANDAQHALECARWELGHLARTVLITEVPPEPPVIELLPPSAA